MRLILLIIFLSGCSIPNEHSQLFKLRGLGVVSEPNVPKPETEVTLTFHAVVPLDETIKAEIYQEEETLYAQLIENATIVDGSETYTDYANFRHYTVQTKFTTPSLSTLEGVTDKNSEELTERMHYGLRLTSGSEEEKIVGDILVAFDDSVPELSFEAPAIAITTPKTSDTLKKNDENKIKAEITNKSGESLKVGWFVSGGNVENRRAAETTWETDDKATQTLVATVRGLRTHSLSIQIIDLSVD